MENNEFDRVKVIQDMQDLKVKKMEEINSKLMASGQKAIDEENLSQSIEIKYLGKIELVSEYGEKIERDWYAVIEQVNGEFQITYYDENQQFLGIQKGIDGEIIPSQSMMWERPDEMKNLKKEDIDKAKNIEELEEEQKEEETQITNDLAKNMEDPKLEIKTYRGITDSVFRREFPETCQGAKNIGMAYLKDGRFMLVADYGNGFEMAKGTEPAIPTTEEVYNEDRKTDTVEKESPHAIMKVSGNGQEQNRKEIAVVIGAYGYIETKVVDRALDNSRRARDLAEVGEVSTEEEKPLEEVEEDSRMGENLGDIQWMIKDFVENNRSNSTVERLINDISELCQVELEDLYRKDEHEDTVKRYIKKIVKDRECFEPEKIKNYVKTELEYDRQMCLEQGFPRRG